MIPFLKVFAYIEGNKNGRTDKEQQERVRETDSVMQFQIGPFNWPHIWGQSIWGKAVGRVELAAAVQRGQVSPNQEPCLLQSSLSGTLSIQKW